MKRLDTYGAHCFVHIDAKVDIAPFQAACSATSATFIGSRTNVVWGGFSLVAATVSLLSAALSDPECSHFVLISGDSYPIKPRDRFRELVMRPFEQIELHEFPPQSPVHNRISQTFLPDTHVPVMPNEKGAPVLPRSLPKRTASQVRRVFKLKKADFPWRYAKGGQWWSLTRATAQRCMDVIGHETELIEWFTYSSVPDEALFQTIMQNFGPFQIGAGSPVYTVWDGAAHPVCFTNSTDLERLKRAPAPLARKFSTEHGSLLLDLLDSWMDGQSERHVTGLAEPGHRALKNAIVYRARAVNPIVQREVDRLVRELPDFKTFIVCYRPEYDSALHSASGTVYYYGQKDLHALPYPQKLSAVNWSNPESRPPLEADRKKFFRAMEWGHQDLPVLKFFVDHPDFDRYWVIEDDVRFSGPWNEIISELARSSADLLMTVVEDHSEFPQWYWWDHLDTGNDVLPLDHRVKGFLPFCRLSAACLQAIDQKYRQGWGGHYEVTWPNIASISRLLIEDIGGQGSYTPAERRGRFYTCTLKSGTLFPGTFLYRPPFHDTGVSEFGKNVTPHSMLWHPVKI